MALQTTALAFGYTFPEAYARVSSYSGDKVTTNFTVETYTCAQARLDGAPAISLSYHQCTYAPDVLSACYSYLKAQPDYSSALDV